MNARKTSVFINPQKTFTSYQPADRRNVDGVAQFTPFVLDTLAGLPTRSML